MTVICISCGCTLDTLPGLEGDFAGGLCEVCRAEMERDVEEQLD